MKEIPYVEIVVLPTPVPVGIGISVDKHVVSRSHRCHAADQLLIRQPVIYLKPLVDIT